MIGYFYLRFGADFRPETVDRAKAEFDRCLQRCGIQGTTTFLLINLMNEIICDILEHGRGSWMEVEIHPEGAQLRLVFRDNGIPFNPSYALLDTNPETWVDHEDLRRMSFFMVSRIAKSWNHRWVDGNMNELKVVVDINSKA
jgi:hypothetical protein